MSDITIPPEALEAAAIALHARWVIMCVQDGGDPLDYERWEGLDEDEKQGWRAEARAACLAMLRSWPGMDHISGWQTIGGWRNARIILPLTQEPEA